jgi:hypothetical protein
MSSRNRVDRLRSAVLSDASVRPRPIAEWTLLGVFGVVLTTVVLGVVGGVAGVGLAAAFVAVWLLVPAVYSYALGHALALGATAGALPVVELLFVELGLLAVLLGPLTRPGRLGRRTVARSTIGLGFVLFAAVVVGLAVREDLQVATVVLLLAGAVLAYGLHRYELLVLGLLDDGDREPGDEEGGDGEYGVDAGTVGGGGS